jgi:hypothetical protein
MNAASLRLTLAAAIALLVAAVAPSYGASSLSGISNAGDPAPKGFDTSGPATIGMVFRQGELPNGAHVVTVDGKIAQAQLDPLVHWPDGSLKFARITVARAGKYDVMPGNSAQTTESQKPRGGMAVPDFQVEVETAHGLLTLSLRQMTSHPKACGPLLCILSFPATPLVNGTTGAKAPNLALRAWVWEYPTLGTSQIVATLENTWAQTASSNVATRNIRFLLNGKTLYQQPDVTIWRWARTRPIRIWTGEKVSDHAVRNLSYLRSTGAVPNFNPELKLAANVLNQTQKRYDKSPRGLMGHTLVTRNMHQTGGRPDIGPIPRWDTFALLTNNPLALKIAREVDDSSAVWPVHLRSTANGKPLSTEQFPKATVSARGRAGNPIPCWDNNCKTRYPKTHIPVRPNIAHEPAMDYVPYLLTADPYYLEELEFWNSWNALARNPAYRDGSKVIFLNTHGQTRGMAWQLRTLSYVLFVLPEHSPEYTYWRSVLQANRDTVIQNWIKRQRLPEPIIPSRLRTNYNRSHGAMAPWQQDFLTWSFGNTVRLGFRDWEPILRWSAEFVVHRLTDPGMCPQLASLYNVKYYNRDGSAVGQWPAMVRATVSEKAFKLRSDLLSLPCRSQALSRALRTPKPGDFAGHPESPQGFVSNMQPAIAAAVDAGVAGAEKAWKIYQERPTKQNYSRYPNWDIVPARHQ